MPSLSHDIFAIDDRRQPGGLPQPQTVRWRRRLFVLIRKLVKSAYSAVVFFISFLVIFGLYHAVFDKSIFIRSIAVPKRLNESGYTPEVVAARLRDAYNSLNRQAATSMKAREMMDRVDVDDMIIPNVGISISTIAAEISSFLHMKRGQIVTGEFVDLNNALFLRVRLDGAQLGVPLEADYVHPDAALVKAATMLMDSIQPYILASAQYTTDKAEALKTTNRILIRYDKSDEEVKYAYALRCVIFRDLQNRQEAKRQCNKSLKIDPSFTVALIDAGSIAEDEKDIPTARALYEKAISVDKNAYIAQYNIGRLLYIANDYNAALKKYQICMKLNPLYASARRGYGNVLLKQAANAPIEREKSDLIDEAIIELERSVDLDPHSSWAHTALADGYVQQDRTDDAIEEYKKAIIADPSNSSPYMKLANIYEARWTYDQANALYKTVLKTDKSNIIASRCVRLN